MGRCEFCEAAVDPATNVCTSCGATQSVASVQSAGAASPRPGSAVSQTGAVTPREWVPFVLIYFCTCGLYPFFLIGSSWPLQFNQLLGEERFNRSKITLMYLITCGIALLYYIWKFIEGLDEVAKKLGLPENPSASTLRLGFVGWFIPYVNLVVIPWHLWQIQSELNRCAAVHNAGQIG